MKQKGIMHIDELRMSPFHRCDGMFMSMYSCRNGN